MTQSGAADEAGMWQHYTGRAERLHNHTEMLREYLVPVSYTHLDVYKRQVAMVVTVALLSWTLIAARKKMKGSESGFRLPGGRILPLAVVIILVLFLVLQESKAIILCGIWFALGYVIYGIVMLKKK